MEMPGKAVQRDGAQSGSGAPPLSAPLGQQKQPRAKSTKGTQGQERGSPHPARAGQPWAGGVEVINSDGHAFANASSRLASFFMCFIVFVPFLYVIF